VQGATSFGRWGEEGRQKGQKDQEGGGGRQRAPTFRSSGLSAPPPPFSAAAPLRVRRATTLRLTGSLERDRRFILLVRWAPRGLLPLESALPTRPSRRIDVCIAGSRPRALIDASPGPAQGSSRSDRTIPSDRRDAARDPMNHPVRSTHRSCETHRTVASIDATVLRDPSNCCLDRRDGPRVPIAPLPRSTRRSSGPYRYVRPTDASGLPDLRSSRPDGRMGSAPPLLSNAGHAAEASFPEPVLTGGPFQGTHPPDPSCPIAHSGTSASVTNGSPARSRPSA
jgi:hypothetical protein